jgi:hypothetical protein
VTLQLVRLIDYQYRVINFHYYYFVLSYHLFTLRIDQLIIILLLFCLYNYYSITFLGARILIVIICIIILCYIAPIIIIRLLRNAPQ